ncbi:6-hydroxymethylpterin diphosphokinase MptE-like protein [Celerinatantimonas sp. YJH-8]|uniref:motility associated factor glycosyltransferase family protein n=1 Tax=Celerinatantimonas sp. YJH-8 TaxID=3228714 RepID=UPI0038C6FD48
MLNAIDYQLCHDEVRQQANETQLAPVMLQNNRTNLLALGQYFPQLGQQLEQYQPTRFSPFVTREQQLNIMYVMRARALYGITPLQQVQQQLADFYQAALYVDKQQTYSVIEPQICPGASLNTIYPGIEARYQAVDSTRSASLVILGCGLGLHLLELVKAGCWSSILLVEPEFDLLKVSLLSADWAAFLDYCNSHHIALEIQTQQQGHELLHSVTQWLTQQDVVGFYLYRHYQYPLFNRLELDLALGRIHWSRLDELAVSESMEMRHYEFGFSLAHYLSESSHSVADQSLFKRNAESFEQFLPDIAASFRQYQPQRWILFADAHQQPNVLDLEQGTTLYLDDGQQASLDYLAHYQAHPKLEKMDARIGARKASPYLHYRYSDQLKTLVQELPEDGFHSLPHKLPSFLMYGCGLGYQLEQLVMHYEIDNFILYEPNADYFYASLFTMNWCDVLQRLDSLQSNLYLNIGDNGEHMVDDILSRLNYSGMHILSYTFFYISYYQRDFDQHIRHTREHMKVLLNISEYYDHAFYNWTHTRESLTQNCPYLLKQLSPVYRQQMADLPVFIVGNGPSLDQSVEVLKAYQDRAIIISCGTSLKALYKYGIKPDFHAEVEQTRSTYHWICQVPDKAWLKQIDLLTVNGVHPDVSSLFRQTFLCFKRGEAATLAALLADPDAGRYQDILYSYPTVSNCAVAYVLALGFKQLYLFGVDLGFTDPRYHHSQQSAYFKEQDGKEIYDYTKHGVGLQVPGNFDDYVFTKYEFRYSAEIIEKTLAEYRGVDCYNTSHGAFIQGTIPLPLDYLLITNDPIDKSAFRKWLLSEAYDNQSSVLAAHLADWFGDGHMLMFLDKLLELAEQPCQNWSEALRLQNQQMALLAASAQNTRSLFFVLMRGTINFSLTYLTRLAFSCDDEPLCMQRYQQGQAIWIDYIKAIQKHYQSPESVFDQTPGLNF